MVNYLILIAIVGSILPTLLWLWFWLRYDESDPEPTNKIIKTFFAGIAIVPIIIALEFISYSLIINKDGISIEDLPIDQFSTIFIIILWVIIEEVGKFIAAYYFALKNKENDEPIDAPIYMITVALGFALIENILYTLSPALDGNLLETIQTTNIRFIGPTLLHVVSSAIVGISISIFYFKTKNLNYLGVYIGLLGAIILHTLFNFLIIEGTYSTNSVLTFVWIVGLIIVLLFEKIKRWHVNKIQ